MEKLKKLTILVISLAAIIFLLIILLLLLPIKQRPQNNNQTFSLQQGEIKIKEPMEIKSSAFNNQEFIPAKYTCDGENINPPLEITNIPETAKSLVLIVDDPDAPLGTWVHWTVLNINPNNNKVKEGESFPGAVEGITSFKKNGYGGPCPPFGTHRYFFKAYALDALLNLNSQAEVKDITKEMEGHIIAKAELVGLYKRQ